MELNDLKDFAKREHKRLMERDKITGKESTLSYAIKIGEEVGELDEEILKHFGFARKEKMEKENNLSHELADVILVSTLIAESLNIDIEKALKEKIEKIDNRYR